MLDDYKFEVVRSGTVAAPLDCGRGSGRPLAHLMVLTGQDRTEHV